MCVDFMKIDLLSQFRSLFHRVHFQEICKLFLHNKDEISNRTVICGLISSPKIGANSHSHARISFGDDLESDCFPTGNKRRGF